MTVGRNPTTVIASRATRCSPPLVIASFSVLRSLPVDIWVTSHARTFGGYRKFLERATAEDPAEAFIDRDGYLGYIDGAQMRFRKLLADQQPSPWRVSCRNSGRATGPVDRRDGPMPRFPPWIR